MDSAETHTATEELHMHSDDTIPVSEGQDELRQVWDTARVLLIHVQLAFRDPTIKLIAIRASSLTIMNKVRSRPCYERLITLFATLIQLKFIKPYIWSHIKTITELTSTA